MLDIKLNSENLVRYARTENAHQAFNLAVGNGQAKLALEVLVDLINGMADIIQDLESKVDELSGHKGNEKQEVAPKAKARLAKGDKESSEEEVMAEV